MTLEEAYNQFLQSDKYKSYSPQTQRQYGYLLYNAFVSQLNGKRIGEIHMDSMDTTTAEQVFRHVSVNGTTAASQFRVAFNAMCKHLNIPSPMKCIQPEYAGKTEAVEAELSKLLSTAYSTFKWRNIGLIIQLTYEQGQPMNKVALCTWDDFDEATGVLVVDGLATNLSASMTEMLKEQKEDFGFQQYIAPSPFPTKNGYVPYGETQLSRTMRKLKAEAGVDTHVNATEIRRLGLAAMLKHGYSEEEVKSLMKEREDTAGFRRMFDKIKKDV